MPEDAPDSMFAGFPFPYVGEGWWTSGAIQFFVLEFIADLLVYFAFWFLLIFLVNCLLVQIKIYKFITIILWCVSAVLIAGAVLLVSVAESSFYITRDFKMEKLDSGHQFLWESVKRPDYYQYRPKEKHDGLNQKEMK